MQLSDRAKQLIPLSRIVSFETWKTDYPESVISIFQEADDQSRYLTDNDFEQIRNFLPEVSQGLDFAHTLREQADQIVSAARHQVLAKYPGITEEGGDLYPPERAQACWRDFWHFLRCISYGIAGQKIPFTSPEGLNNMQLLYQELRVPLSAMVEGLEQLKIFSLQQFDQQQQQQVSPYFDHLVQAMKQFYRS